MHLKLLLQEGPKHSAAESFSNQSAWNDEFRNDQPIMKSFMTSIVGRNFQTRRKTLQAIFDKCDEWETTQSWKFLLLLLRIVIDSEECAEFSQDERNDIKALVKSMFKSCFFLG